MVKTVEPKVRCPWAKLSSPNYVSYHDKEWGVAVRNDRKHFEFLCLEGAQAGLNWELILNKREGYRKAFYNFDPETCANLSNAYLEKQLSNSEIVRNKLKINTVRKNAQVFLEIQKEFKSFNKYIWGWVGGNQIVNTLRMGGACPSTTAESDAIAKDLKKRGMSFVGSTIMYSYMQAAGLVNDHVVECFRYEPCIRK